MEYRVTWIIDIDADSPNDAARLARQVQLDPDSTATHFIVQTEDGHRQEVWTTRNEEEPEP